MSSETLLRLDHAALRAITAGLRLIAEQDTPPPRAKLTDARWQLFAALLRQFSLEDRILFGRLMRHPDPDVAQRAKAFNAENLALYDMFFARSGSWTPQEAESDWLNFRAALQELTLVIDMRLARSANEMLPHLAGAPPADDDAPASRDWSAEADRLRERLGFPPMPSISLPFEAPAAPARRDPPPTRDLQPLH